MPGVNWIYASGAVIWGELQKLRTLLRLCCATAVPMGSDRGADDRRGLSGEGVSAIGAARPIDRVLEAARDGAIIFGRHTQDRFGCLDRRLEAPGARRIIAVIILAAEYGRPTCRESGC